ncbi:MAG: AEC family transporter [Aestuariivirga sp.]|uniref:AEC family transporter n=1 Tax=Aestuariivirga sp. TaxID=2650926 RepID=UPI0025BCE4CE|nr:AEC family transporter [Aestuariivirga sp.]MCA3561625.1 AEC family transporter [Aestuariivirga sp.]
MDSILNTVLPVFGMIVLGYGLTKARVFDAAAGRGLSLFVFNLAIPALLFKTVATMGAQQGAPWQLWIAFFGGLGITWVTTALVSRVVPSLNVSGGAAASMAAGFGNLALLGTPLALSHFGQQVAIPLGMILSIHAPILWFTAMLHRALFQTTGGFSIGKTAWELFRHLATNAIVLGLLAGTLWRLAGWGLHPVFGTMLGMLADASVPTALFALGVSLAGYSLRGSWSGMFTLIGLKMVLMPFLVFILVHYAVSIPPLWGHVAILFAAMPTGANAFLFSQRNNEATAAVSGAIALGTALAALSASILLYLMDGGVI